MIKLFGERMETFEKDGKEAVHIADLRSSLRKRHAACSDRLAELKALPSRTPEQKDMVNDYIESCQFFEREISAL
jgi:hypothetical protein